MFKSRPETLSDPAALLLPCFSPTFFSFFFLGSLSLLDPTGLKTEDVFHCADGKACRGNVIVIVG